MVTYIITDSGAVIGTIQHSNTFTIGSSINDTYFYPIQCSFIRSKSSSYSIAFINSIKCAIFNTYQHTKYMSLKHSYTDSYDDPILCTKWNPI